MKPNGPAKRLFIDDEDKNQREKKSEDNTRKIRKNAEQARFREDKFAQLLAGRTEVTQKAELAAAVNDERKKRSGDAHDGYQDGDSLKSVSDGEGAIEDLHGLRAEITIRKDQYAVVTGGLFDFFVDGGHRRAWRNKNGQIRGRCVGQIVQQDVAIHQNHAALAGVIVIHIGDTERDVRFSEREFEQIAGFDVVFVSEGLAYNDVVRAAKFGQNGFCGTAGKKIRCAINLSVVEIHGTQCGRQTLVADFVCAKTLHGTNAGQSADGV